jgi:hypothetical protein
LKLDRKGSRFGFVRFWEVQNVESLLRKLEEIWFDTYKLGANLAMHTRGGEYEGKGKHADYKPKTWPRHEGGEVKHGISFKQTLVNGNLDSQNNEKKGKECANTPYTKKRRQANQFLDSTMEVTVVEENLKRYESCWVGKLWEQDQTENIQFKIWMEGYQTIKATTLGLDLVLLSSNTQDGVKKAVEGNTDWWSRVFIEIRPWSPILRPRGRRVWVRIFGTPLHVWGEDCFSKVVCKFGRFVKMDEPTKEQQRLEFARVQVLLNGWHTIDEQIDIRVGGEVFVMKMVEEQEAAMVKSSERVFGSTNQCESNTSIGTPVRRWVEEEDEDGLNGDWSGWSVPERPLNLNSNVAMVGPVDFSNIQQLPDTSKPVPVKISMGREEGYV